jgi:hypothetical protein
MKKDELKKGGVDETHYVRIRPEQKDGKSRGSILPQGNVARLWQPTPAFVKSDKKWAKPTWVQVVGGARKAGRGVHTV